jgi:hypothetical protein
MLDSTQSWAFKDDILAFLLKSTQTPPESCPRDWDDDRDDDGN